MGRKRISLDGVWSFRHEDAEPRSAQVPMPWQAQFADLRHSSGKAEYSRSFPRPTGTANQQVWILFGAVSYLAEVRVNGQFLLRHEGGYLPFECLLPDEIMMQDNVLTVSCLLPDGNSATSPDAPFAEIPHGKQSWYGPLGGIWQSVAIELRDPCHLVHCAIAAQISGQMSVTLALSVPGVTAQLTVMDPEGQVVAETTQPDFHIDKPRLWSPDDPALYCLRVTLPGADSTDHQFGFRQFEARDGQFFLNGQPWFMRAALDQDYYPEGICTPPSLAFLEDQVRKAKELGLNMLRCHIKVPDPRYYEVANRLGMLIWTEIPNVATFTKASSRRLRATMEGILRRDGNHPCIVIWTLVNEDWGTRLAENPAHRQWLAATFDWLKQRDPSRLVVDNSPCHGNFHVKTDINDFHYYRSVPERRAEWDALTAEFAQGADWTYSPFGDAQRSGTEPLVVSEFGVWGLPDPARVELGGQEPWWMGTGATWGDGVAYPHGIQDRFATLQLGTVFGSFERFIEAAQWYQFANLKYEIEVMRGWPAIQGYVITEFTDVHWESNGLLDMNRNPRVFHDRFAEVNADVVIVPKVAQYAGWAGKTLRFGLSVATGGQALKDAVLRWSGPDGQGGRIVVPPTGPQSLADLGEISIILPEGRNQMVPVTLVLDSGGKTLNRNQVEFAAYQHPDRANLPTVATEDAALISHLTALGFEIVAAGKADVTLVRQLDAVDVSRMQAGGIYLVLAGEHTEFKEQIRKDAPRREQPFLPVVDDIPGLPGNPEGQLPNMTLSPRHGSIWRGDWIAGFSWIRRAGVFADMPGGPMMDLSFDRVVPRQVLTGFRAWEFGGPVHAGMVVGWVHKPAAFIAERRVGSGGLVASTFRLTGDAPGSDPVASFLLHALVRLAAQIQVETHDDAA